MVAWSQLFEDDPDLADILEHAFGRTGVEMLSGAIHKRRVAARTALSSRGQGPQGKKRAVRPFSWDEHVMRLTERQFKRRYRLSFDSFSALLDKLRVDLDVVNQRLAMNGRGGTLVPNAVKLAIGLRYLAGGDPLDLFLIYNVSHCYVYKCVWAVIDAVNRRLVVEFPIDEPDKLATLEREFRAKSLGGIWEGQVGALDGVHIATIAPSNLDVKDAMRYHVARKDEYAILCMAVCDAERRFTYYDISQVPTTHDSLAWAVTPLGQRIAAGDLPAPYFINGDAAFSTSPSMVCPSGLPEHDDFDYHQSSNRMAIECAFGILVQRWGVLWRPLRCRFDRRAPLVGACIRLHNWCIDWRVSEITHVRADGRGQYQPGRWAVAPIRDRYGRPVDNLDIEREPPVRARARRVAAAKDARLLELVRLVKDSGVSRPPLQRGQYKKSRGRKRA